MKKYYRLAVHKDTVKNHTSASGKAIHFTISNGYTSANDTTEWFPLSQLIIGEPNECGWCEILIPAWLLKQKNISYSRIRETEVWNGEEYIVER